MELRCETSTNINVRTPSDLTRKELIRLATLFAGNVLVHYGMWFTETVNKLGLQETLNLESRAFQKYYPLAIKKLGPHLKKHEPKDLDIAVSKESETEIIALIQDLAKTWVASDGVWFQAVEARAGMAVAKEINDTCWANFAALEASKILAFLGLQAGGGLRVLQQALEFRTYSVINMHTCDFSADGSLVLTFQECRVQNSRRRKRMGDYPCKSAGFIEYSHFATLVDNRIVTECVYCPPDSVKADQFCSWRFVIN